MSYQTLLNAVAQVVGGTQPNNSQTSALAGPPDQRPYWFSGLETGDGSGVAGLAGCWSVAPDVFTNTPVGVVLPDGWTPQMIGGGQPFPRQGRKYREDVVHVRVMTGHTDLQSQMSSLVNFADLVPTAFDTHMQLFNQAGVDTADCSTGVFLEVEWPTGTVYMAVQFIVKIRRAIPVTYTA